ncbi:MAG TPA: DUF3124 domain-containing protein [Spirochaetota bacterium]|nr:DUF3124 domain-containing protein [Spirochaetota bacterium]HPL15924.1 DUF3124 domain-containing protein [Spirochaetota bacterium]HPV42179.1 DUF3124 domain-containing protein [Spirochaetota bacterium]
MVNKKRVFVLLYAALFFLLCPLTISYEKPLLSRGQTIYVPVYSSIYHGDKNRKWELAVTLSIRNTNINNSILINLIDYYDSDGKKIKILIKQPQKLKPLESRQIIINESDLSGGIGANFIVTWSSDKQVNPPLIESIMIGTRGQQGISFSARGVVIQENL